MSFWEMKSAGTNTETIILFMSLLWYSSSKFGNTLNVWGKNHKVIKFLALQNRVFKYASWTGWILIGENLSPCVFLSFSKPQAYVRQTTASRIKELKSYLLTTGIWRRFPHFIILCESVRRVSGNFLLLFFYHYVIVYDIETAINERTQTVKQAVFESFSTG